MPPDITKLRERIATRNGRRCPVCGEPADHFGPTVELTAGDRRPALVHRTDQYAYVHHLED